MTGQPPADPIETTVAEAPPVAAPAKKAAASLKLLDGNEIVQLSIRASPWCILLYSLKALLALALIAAAVAITSQGQPSGAAAIALLVILLVAFSAVVAATLQWASRLYVLTNRRALRFRGVFNVEAAECALSQIRDARVQTSWFQPMLRLGSIHMTPTDSAGAEITWEHVARPGEVYEILAQAIQKAKTGS